MALRGERLGDAKGILFYGTGIEAKEFAVADDKSIKAKVNIAPDCPVGEHALRVWTASGISELRTFFVGRFPSVEAKESNRDADHAQPIPLNVTVNGVIKSEQTDWFSVDVKKGQRLTVEVEGMRLGRGMLDPWICVTSKAGREIARNDDSSLFLQDPLLSAIVPEDGPCLIQIRDSAFGGSDQCRYRMHVTTAPQPLVVYPAGGPTGGEIDLRFIGDATGPISQKTKLPVEAEPLGVFAEQDGATAAAANSLRVSTFPNVLEAEPDNDLQHATVAETPPPVALNGIIETAGDTDYFRFKAKKDETFDVHVYARRLRSPLDSVLQILDANGKQLGSNDDAGGPDSYLRFKAPADGEYGLSVKDQLARGGAAFTYRVEVTPAKSGVELALPVVTQQPSQDRQAVPVPRGNRYATMVRAKRTEFGGEILLQATGLPDGVNAQTVPTGGDMIPVVFEAAPEAAVTGKLCDLTARPTETKQRVASRFVQEIPLVLGNPNNSVYYKTEVEKVPVAVTEEAPIRISVVEPKVPLVQNGSMNLKVNAERRNGFNGPINLSMLYNPNGVGSQSTVTIPAGQTEAVIPLNASGDAQTRIWKIAVTANADAGKGAVWVSSQFANLEIAPPFVTARIERTKAVQGQPATLICSLKQNRPFEGKAKVQLLNLPNKASAPEAEITAADGEVKFEVTTDKGTPTGAKKDLFCQLVIMKDGEPIVHNIAQGGILRVDAPAGKVAAK